MTKNCSCMGLNENCYKCFGRGYYEEDEPRPFPTNRPLTDTKSKQSKRNDKLENHVKKARYVSSVRRVTDVQSKQNQQAKKNILRNNIWFVLHQSGLYNINSNIIGFRDSSEWSRIKKNHMIFYYRTSPYQQIMGVYKVMRSDKDIDRNFIMTINDKSEYLRLQHELELVYPLHRHFGTDEHKLLSFYPKIKWKNRWDKKNVFPMNIGDVELIANQYSVEVLGLLSI